MSILWLCDQLRLNSSPLNLPLCGVPRHYSAQRTPGPLEWHTGTLRQMLLLLYLNFQPQLGTLELGATGRACNYDYFYPLFRHSESTGHYGGDKVICTDEWDYQPSRNSYTMELAKIPKKLTSNCPNNAH